MVKEGSCTHKIQNRHFHHTLVEVSSAVLNHLDRHHFLRLQVLTLDNLTKCPLSENVEYKITVPGTAGLAEC